MPRCPFGPHRLALTDELRCRHCRNDFTAYAMVRDWPVALFNEARRLWDLDQVDDAARLLAAALALRPAFMEAHWLMAAVEARRGHHASASRFLDQARSLGAPVGSEPPNAQAPDPPPEPDGRG